MGSFPGKGMAYGNTGLSGMTINKERAEVNYDMFYST